MKIPRLILLGALLINASAASSAIGQVDPVFGIWRNPHGTIDIRTSPCPTGLCGAIVRASSQAIADAREAGVDKLIGLQLLKDYHQSGSGHWAGRVYVPDMGRSFSSRIDQIASDQLKISGCLWGGWICKSQVWHRV
jgi:uncharacterized protein (DUF2147 family)